MTDFTIDCGDRVKDKITGFIGVVLGRVQYISGCNQYLVQPSVGTDDKFVDSRWFDEQRLNIIKTSAVKLDSNVKPGADRPAPSK